MTWKRKAFSRRILEAAFLMVLLSLLPLGLIAQNGQLLSSPSHSVFSQGPQQPQESPTEDQPTAEATHERQVSVREDSAGNDKPVRVIEKTVRVGRLIHKVKPKYPKAARKAHIEGTVVLSAEIGKDGKIANLRVVSGPKELIASAVKAVQEWVYKPYLLAGEPVDVETEIRINFSLN